MFRRRVYRRRVESRRHGSHRLRNGCERIGKIELPTAAERLVKLDEVERQTGRALCCLLLGLQQRSLGVEDRDKIRDTLIVARSGER
jgi:hypothetical protein